MSVKEKIIDAAYKLFCKYGYENTSVQKIVDVSGTSKGGFYHHFKTKEDVIQAILNGFVKDLEKQLLSIPKKENLSVFEMINDVIKEVNSYKAGLFSESSGIARMMSFENNTVVMMLIGLKFQEMIKSAYQKIIEKGVREGKFQTEYINYTAALFSREILEVYKRVTSVSANYSKKDYDDFARQLDFTQTVLNQALGLEEEKILIKDEAIDYLDKSIEVFKREALND